MKGAPNPPTLYVSTSSTFVKLVSLGRPTLLFQDVIYSTFQNRFSNQTVLIIVINVLLYSLSDPRGRSFGGTDPSLNWYNPDSESMDGEDIYIWWRTPGTLLIYFELGFPRLDPRNVYWVGIVLRAIVVMPTPQTPVDRRSVRKYLYRLDPKLGCN